jgi:acyl-CoA reductase-like NAD-dependent aldehyde dehydrogenase
VTRAREDPAGRGGRRQTVAHCQSLVDDALDHGATLLVGGETTQNVLMPAHVVAGVTQDMKLFRDESFGPVVGVIHARDEAHAIELANDSEYGLSAAVFTPRHRARPARGAPDPLGHLPRQRPHRAR